MLVVLDLLDIIVLALFHYVASVVLDEGSFLSRENICSREYWIWLASLV